MRKDEKQKKTERKREREREREKIKKTSGREKYAKRKDNVQCFIDSLY